MKDYSQVNKVIANRTNEIKKVFCSNEEKENKVLKINSLRLSLMDEVECFGLSRNVYSVLVDKMLILLGKNGVRDVRIEGKYIFVDVDGRTMNAKDNAILFDALESEFFTLARIKTRKWRQQEQSKDLAVFMYPKQGTPTKYYSRQEGAKVYGY